MGITKPLTKQLPHRMEVAAKSPICATLKGYTSANSNLLRLRTTVHGGIESSKLGITNPLTKQLLPRTEVAAKSPIRAML